MASHQKLHFQEKCVSLSLIPYPTSSMLRAFTTLVIPSNKTLHSMKIILLTYWAVLNFLGKKVDKFLHSPARLFTVWSRKKTHASVCCQSRRLDDCDIDPADGTTNTHQSLFNSRLMRGEKITKSLSMKWELHWNFFSAQPKPVELTFGDVETSGNIGHNLNINSRPWQLLSKDEYVFLQSTLMAWRIGYIQWPYTGWNKVNHHIWPDAHMCNLDQCLPCYRLRNTSCCTRLMIRIHYNIYSKTGYFLFKYIIF